MEKPRLPLTISYKLTARIYKNSDIYLKCGFLARPPSGMLWIFCWIWLGSKSQFNQQLVYALRVIKCIGRVNCVALTPLIMKTGKLGKCRTGNDCTLSLRLYSYLYDLDFLWGENSFQNWNTSYWQILPLLLATPSIPEVCNHTISYIFVLVECALWSTVYLHHIPAPVAISHYLLSLKIFSFLFFL